jgi:DNA-directed RNA polymerase specialized sigma24 family protein
MNKYVRVNRDWLPKEDAKLIQLREGGGWPFSFIAEALNRPEKGVMVRYYRLSNGNARQHPSELN